MKIFGIDIGNIFIVDFSTEEERKKDKTTDNLVTFFNSQCLQPILMYAEEREQFHNALANILSEVKQSKSPTLLYLIGHGAPSLIGGKKDLPDEWRITWHHLLPVFQSINTECNNQLYINLMFVCRSAGILEDSNYTPDCFRFLLASCKDNLSTPNTESHNSTIFPNYDKRMILESKVRISQIAASEYNRVSSFESDHTVHTNPCFMLQIND